MWPWEHLAFGYLGLSLGSRALRGRGPSDGATIALAVGTQFPDLVDKPLAWGLGVLPSGTSLGHSLLVAVPVTVASTWVARRWGRGAVGAAFALGYLSHLAGDVLYPLATDGELRVGKLLWPLVPAAHGKAGSMLGTVAALWDVFRSFLATPRGRVYLAAEVLVLAGVAVLWLADGAPGLPRVRVRDRILGRSRGRGRDPAGERDEG